MAIWSTDGARDPIRITPSSTTVDFAIRLGLLGYWSFRVIAPLLTIALWSVMLAVAPYPQFEHGWELASLWQSLRRHYRLRNRRAVRWSNRSLCRVGCGDHMAARKRCPRGAELLPTKEVTTEVGATRVAGHLFLCKALLRGF